MDRQKNIVIAFITNMILANATAYHFGKIFLDIGNSKVFYSAFSATTIIGTISLFYFYKKLNHFIFKIALCVVCAIFVPVLSFVGIGVFVEFNPGHLEFDLADINVLVGLGLGSVLLWLPISVIWYLSFENYFILENVNHRNAPDQLNYIET